MVEEISVSSQDVLQNFGQFYSCEQDFVFLAKLSRGDTDPKERDAWFLENSGRMVWFIALGVLASVLRNGP